MCPDVGNPECIDESSPSYLADTTNPLDPAYLNLGFINENITNDNPYLINFENYAELAIGTEFEVKIEGEYIIPGLPDLDITSKTITFKFATIYDYLRLEI